ncbi:hypothetical protein [Methylorubrum suomiense]|uniref:Uncharacterized protein n=1 Tax=Methylorubrum suomiense TaxID=144191 RepID=A0ABQ4V0X8_9HYPH|nr:hypothetical protein [Methylorubrum suomiense]GJE78072.1 hypothetical protein BGCPKDLD_4683 [Methylorubrum suomiense]
MEVYLFDPVKHPPARLRWEEARERCQDWHDHYEETRQMTNKIQTAEGPQLRGPDEPALAEAMQREEATRAVGCALVGASVGEVAPRQAGILPSGPMRVSDEMFERAWTVARDFDLTGADVRAILEAALRG